MVEDHKQHKKKQVKKKKKTREESDSSPSYSDSESSDSEADRKRSGKSRKEKDRSRRRKDKRHHDEEKRKKRKKKSRHQSSDEESGSSDTDEEERRKKRKLLKEAKRILKEHKRAATSSGSSANKVVPKILTEADYFEKNKEFSTWLKEERGIYFSSLSAEDTRGIFLDFIEAWNSGKISEKLYNGVDSATRTDHKWKIRHDEENLADKEEELEFIKKLEKSKRKKFRKENEDLMDELLPKATGKERLLEKKAIRRESARDREDSPEIFKERDIMGGGDDFKQRLEREQARREKKASERSAALAEKQLVFDQKESAAMNQLKSLIDTAGGRITIPKRTN